MGLENDLLFVNGFHQQLLTLLYNTREVLIKNRKIQQYADLLYAVCFLKTIVRV